MRVILHILKNKEEKKLLCRAELRLLARPGGLMWAEEPIVLGAALC